jgi:hypothetical protein
MRRLADAVEADPEKLTPLVQQVLGPWEEELLIATDADPESAARELGSRVETLRAHAERLMQLVSAVQPEVELARP